MNNSIIIFTTEDGKISVDRRAQPERIHLRRERRISTCCPTVAEKRTPMPIKPGKYIHFKGNKYEILDTATHSETLEEMVIYRALYGDGSVWVRPAAMWDEIVEHNGRRVKRFTPEDEFVSEKQVT